MMSQCVQETNENVFIKFSIDVKLVEGTYGALRGEMML
jgi:hypothetical protein